LKKNSISFTSKQWPQYFIIIKFEETVICT